MDRKGVNKIKCSSSHETCVRWCLNILRAVKGLMWRFTSCCTLASYGIGPL